MGSSEKAPGGANSATKGSNRRRFNRRRNNSQKSASSPNPATNNEPKIREFKFYLHDSAQRKSSESYNKIVDNIIIKIQKTFDQPIEIADSIKNKAKKVFTEPELADPVTDGSAEVQKRKDEMNMRKWSIQFEHYEEKKDKFDAGWRNAYSLIWDSYCSKDIQRAITELPDYEAKIQNDPLQLLEAIEGLMHTPEKAKYPVLTMVEIMANFLKCR